MTVSTTPSPVGTLVHQQDSFGGSSQGACYQIQWQSGGHIHMHKSVYIQTPQLVGITKCLHICTIRQ